MHRANYKFIELELRDDHKRLCTQYKDSKTDDEAHNKYLAICSWWFTSGVAMESEILGRISAGINCISAGFRVWFCECINAPVCLHHCMPCAILNRSEFF
jgi:hypothetical protein